MPVRDHFRPPVSKKSSWEGFHAMWPTCIVQQLRNQLPPGFVAEPRVHLGTLMEIEVGALESDDPPRVVASSGNGNGNGGTATAVWTATLPAVVVDTEPPDEFEYEVRIFDVERERQLVAAVEFVSPANKDRRESREAFVAKCAALLRKGVAVSIVDLVTIRRFNLYAQLMAFIGHPDPFMTADEPATYAASCRWVTKGTRATEGLVPHSDHRPAAADAAAVVGGRAGHSARSGAELRASVPRFVVHVTAAPPGHGRESKRVQHRLLTARQSPGQRVMVVVHRALDEVVRQPVLPPGELPLPAGEHGDHDQQGGQGLAGDPGGR